MPNDFMFSKAIILATNAHKGQIRKGSGLPYIIHPMRVVNEVLLRISQFNLSLDEKDILISAAILHDVVEDTSVTLSQIETEFGSRVKDLVHQLTSDEKQIKEKGKTAYLSNKMAFVMDEDALLIKLCDRLDNVRDYHDQISTIREKADAYFQSTIEILSSLVSLRSLAKVHRDLIDDIMILCGKGPIKVAELDVNIDS